MSDNSYDKEYILNIGDDYDLILDLKLNKQLIDVTGYTFKMQIRNSLFDDSLVYELSSALGNIEILDAVNGKIVIRIANSVTSTFDDEQAYFDLKWTDTDAKVKTILKGQFKITQTITK